MRAHGNTISVLPDIYDSAVESSIWGDTLEKSAHALGAKGAILLIIDQRPEGRYQVNHFSKIWSRAPERAAMYTEKYGHYEKPVWDKLFTSPKQNLVLDTDFWADEPDLINRPDYQYLRENVGIVHKCAARLNDNMSWWDTLVVHFDKELKAIPQNSIAGINQLLPHVAKSVELSRAFDMLREQYNAVLAALDHVEIGMCIALQNGDLVVRNSEANRILDEKDGLRLSSDGKLFCHQAERNAQLQQAIKVATQTACGKNTTHELLFVNERKSTRAPLLIEVAPLTDYSGELEPQLRGALVTLIDPSNTQPFSVDRAVAAYQLTKAEGEVCKLLVEGNATSIIAEKRNVSPETIKTQVKSIFCKTACARRSDLIRLVLKTTPPVS